MVAGSENCGDEEVDAMGASLDLFRSQLWSVDCGDSMEMPPVCDPFTAAQSCLFDVATDCE